MQNNVIYVDFKKEKPVVKDVEIPEGTDNFVVATKQVIDSLQRLNAFMTDLREQGGVLGK